MKRQAITMLLIFFSLFSFSQKKGYLGVDLGIDFLKNSDPSVGGYVSGNGEIAPGLFTGLQVGIVKIQGLSGVYIPLQARITALMSNNQKKITPIVFLEPGWGAYSKADRYVRTQGGFVFFGGIGVKLPSQKDNSGAILSLGYSSYGFKVNDIKSHSDGIGVRFGIML